VYETEHRVRCKDGSYKWVLDRAKVVEHDGRGVAVRMVGTQADVTARRIQQQLLELHGTIIKNMSEGVCVIRPTDGTIIYANPRFCRMLGYAADELDGKSAASLRKPDWGEVDDRKRAGITEELRARGQASYEYVTQRRDGTRIV